MAHTRYVKIKGISPMLMHDTKVLDPTHPLKKAMDEITRKSSKQKTDEDFANLKWLEFQASCYWREGVGAVMPAINIEACIRDGARKVRKGKDFERGLMVGGQEEFIPLSYAPKRSSLAELFKDTRFVDTRRACSGSKSSAVMRTRPRFDEWELSFPVTFDGLNPDDVKKAIVTAGRECGLGDFRPRFGRFELVAFGEKPLTEGVE